MAFAERNRLVKNRGQKILLKELSRIENVERSDIRMLETSRHRLRSRLKKFELPQLSSGSDAIDVRMYDTHNPGFCYHCTGAIRACDKIPRKKLVDIFDAVRSMLFTDGEVDPEKILCLHVLTAHYAKSESSEFSNVRPITPLIEKGNKESFSGAWNHVLPCYVIDIQSNVNDGKDFSDDMKRHKDPFVIEAEDQIVKDFHSRYKKYLEENSDVDLALSNNQKRATMVPNGIGKIAIIPPHIYSLLGAAQELKIKQAIAEESRRKKFRRSSSSIRNIDDQSISFRLEDDEDAISARLMTATSIHKEWPGPRIASHPSKISGFQSLSRKSGTSSHRTDLWSITTLSRASPRSNELPLLLRDLRTDPQIVTIKPSNRAMGRIVSKSSSTKSPFRNFSSTLHGPESPFSNSVISGVSGLLGESRKIRRPIFLNHPVKSPELTSKNYKTVPIMVNNQMQALVHSVMDVLERVNPSKVRKIVSMANSPKEIREMMTRPEIQIFVESLVGQPLVSSPSSFVTSMASIIYEIDPRVESSIEKELAATTLAVPPAPGLHRLVEEIRGNLFVDPDQNGERKAEMKVETFGSQRQKLLEFKPHLSEELGVKRYAAVFDVDTLCPHSDIQGNKMTCACCYSKWKDSLPDSERSLVPDFSFLSCHGSQLTPGNAAKLDLDNCHKINSRSNEESNLSAETISQKERLPVTGLKRSERNSLMRITQNRNMIAKKSSGKSINAKRKLSVDEAQMSFKDSRRFAGSITAENMTTIVSPQPQCSEINFDDKISSTKCQFKPWKVSRDPSYLDPDRIILRRMTNPQRILVGQMCASMKTRKVNKEGIVKERIPLVALIAPVLSAESLRVLTQGTRQEISRSKKRKATGEKEESSALILEKLSGPVLAKVRQAVAESETDRRLMAFLKSKI